jgi:galactokinase
LKNAPRPSLFRAPARVNIIGEHTDYNDGLVLPTTSALFTSVSALPRSDRIVRVHSLDLQETEEFDLDDLEPDQRPRWIDYAKGVAAEIEAEGIHLHGANLEVASDIPLGGGLSSSASFELAVATALIGVAGATLPKLEIAKLCQRAEIRYAGVNCGIMDQYTVASCKRGNAILLDCRSLAVEQAAIPTGAAMLITHSGVEHKLPDSGYNDRARECAEAVAILGNSLPGVTALRDVTAGNLEAHKNSLGDRLYRRCRHVVSENQRVRDAYDALTNSDIEGLGHLILESHLSLRDDYQVSCAEVDRLVQIACTSDGVLGARMIGGGFGGCVLSLVESDKIDTAARQIRQKYATPAGDEPWMHVVCAADPAGEFAHEE